MIQQTPFHYKSERSGFLESKRFVEHAKNVCRGLFLFGVNCRRTASLLLAIYFPEKNAFVVKRQF